MAHASQESIVVAKAFVKGEAKKSPLANISTGDYRYPEKGRRVTTNGERIYSYGWWEIARRDVDDPDLVWVTTDQYQTGYWNSGRPKYSPTTNGHIQAVRDELHYAGYKETDEEFSFSADHESRSFVGYRRN